AEGASDAADRRARGLPSRPVRGRRRVRPAGRCDRHLYRHPHRRPPRRLRVPPGRRRHRRRLRPARRERRVPAEARRPRDRDRPGRMILLVDNYDSFTYNLAHLLDEAGGEVLVRRNDEITPDEATRLAPSHLVLSPGPGRPADAGALPEIVERLAGRMPTLGVCLGHQAIVEAFGGEIGPAERIVHGKASPVRHDGRGLFRGLPETFEAGRYPSLTPSPVPDRPRLPAASPRARVQGVPPRPP